jgi:hypothetical protein
MKYENQQPETNPAYLEISKILRERRTDTSRVEQLLSIMSEIPLSDWGARLDLFEGYDPQIPKSIIRFGQLIHPNNPEKINIMDTSYIDPKVVGGATYSDLDEAARTLEILPVLERTIRHSLLPKRSQVYRFAMGNILTYPETRAAKIEPDRRPSENTTPIKKTLIFPKDPSKVFFSE